MEEIKKIVVLGSNSFTGSHFIDYALVNSDTKIIGVSRSTEKDPIFLPHHYKKNHSSRFSFYQIDLNNHFDNLMKLLDREKPEVIMNYAAQGEVRNSWRWPDHWFQTNTMNVVRLAHELKDRNYLKKYLNVSTSAVYADSKEAATEHSLVGPSTPYGVSKLAADMYLSTIHGKDNFPVITQRTAIHYGIHQDLFRIIPKTIVSLKRGEVLPLHGGGKSTSTFTNVRDLAVAANLLIYEGKPGETYNITSEDRISINDLVRKVCEMMGKSFEERTKVEASVQPAHQFSMDCSKIKSELGWQQTVSLEEGIEEMIGWISDNWEVMQAQDLEYAHKV